MGGEDGTDSTLKWNVSLWLRHWKLCPCCKKVAAITNTPKKHLLLYEFMWLLHDYTIQGSCMTAELVMWSNGFWQFHTTYKIQEWTQQCGLICISDDLQWITFLVELMMMLRLTVCLLFLFCLRDPQDWSDGWQHLVAGQHKPDGLLSRELRPPELETADSTAPHQTSSMTVCL